MKIVSFVRVHITYFLLIPILLCVVGIGISVLKPVSNQQSTISVDRTALLNEFETLLKEPDDDRLVKLQPKVKEFIINIGIDEILNMVKDGLINHEYDISECHRMLHLIGHFSYSPGDTNFDTLVEHDPDLCGGAYQHGIEAQIALTSQEPLQDLHKFCAAVQTVRPGADCYHGAGHEQMNASLDVHKALLMCDRIGPGSPVEDLTDCYQGVFSEYVFQLEGIDGDTGIPFSGGPELQATFEHPLDFCMSLDIKYQSGCAWQLSRVLMEQNQSDDALTECLQKRFPVPIQSACVREVTAVISQHIFAQDMLLSVSPIILNQSEEIKKAHVAGAAGE